MKVLLVNGSPRKDGNTYLSLDKMKEIFASEGIETEMFQLDTLNTHGCLACDNCIKTGKCVQDQVNLLINKIYESDGVVFASPVYFAGPNAGLLSLMDCVFHCLKDCSGKVAGSVAVARRIGISTTLDELNRYLLGRGFAVCGTTFWGGVYGRNKGEALQDTEGIQTIENLARNMSFIINCIDNSKDKFNKPTYPEKIKLNYIR